MYLFLVMLGLCCCAWTFSSGNKQGLLFIAVCGLLIAEASFFCGAQALGSQASVVAAHGLSHCGLRALEHWVSSCGTQAPLLCNMWDLPGPGVKTVSLALQDGFLTTGPPRKPRRHAF